MKSLPDRLNDRFEHLNIFGPGKQLLRSQSPILSRNDDPGIDELVMLAQRLQTAPHLQVDSDFALHLEVRMLAHRAALSHRAAITTHRNRLSQRFHHLRLAVRIALICLLLVGTMGTLTAAAQTTNPLYQIKQWMQSVQHHQTTPFAAQAETNWHSAHDQLDTLVSLADQAHAAAYHQALIKFDQQINILAQSIKAQPAGPDKDNLSNRLEALKAEARQVLRGLLPRLTVSEKLLTTDELGRLDDTIPYIDRAVMIVFLHSAKLATVNIVGENLQSGARLLIDNQLVMSGGSLQNDMDIFVVNWSGEQSPKTIGILNPDGTVAQTATITFTVTDANGNEKGNNNGNSGGNGNDNSSSNGNGNGNNSENGNGNSSKNSNGNGNSNGNSNNK